MISHICIATPCARWANNNYSHLILDVIKPLLEYMTIHKLHKEDVILYFDTTKSEYINILKLIVSNVLPKEATARIKVIFVCKNKSYAPLIVWKNTIKQLYFTPLEKTTIVYVVREDNRRKVINNIECIDALTTAFGSAYTIVPVQYELMTFEEQVKSLNNCKILITPHGAGTTNCLFLNNNSGLLEIFPPSFSYTAYENICKNTNNKYKKFHCDSIPPPQITLEQFIALKDPYGVNLAITLSVRDCYLKINPDVLLENTHNLLKILQ